MDGSKEKLVWVTTFAALVVFAIPWFLWGVDAVVAGLPVWVWWHVGWMLVASVVFWLFGERAWGIGIADARGDGGEST